MYICACVCISVFVLGCVCPYVSDKYLLGNDVRGMRYRTISLCIEEKHDVASESQKRNSEELKLLTARNLTIIKGVAVRKNIMSRSNWSNIPAAWNLEG